MEKGDGVENTEIGTQKTVSPVVEKQAKRRIFKIIVIGDSNVGKTCLTFRFCGGQFPKKVEATIGVDFREKTVDVDDEMIKVRHHHHQLMTSLTTSVKLGPVAVSYT